MEAPAQITIAFAIPTVASTDSQIAKFAENIKSFRGTEWKGDRPVTRTTTIPAKDIGAHWL